MSLRKPNHHYLPREISQSERRLHCRNLFLVANENGVLSNFTRSHISSDRVRSGYEIKLNPQFNLGAFYYFTPEFLSNGWFCFIIQLRFCCNCKKSYNPPKKIAIRNIQRTSQLFKNNYTPDLPIFLCTMLYTETFLCFERRK